MCEKKVIEDPDPIPQVKPAYITETQKVLERYKQPDLSLNKIDVFDIDESGRKLRKIRKILVLDFITSDELRNFEQYGMDEITAYTSGYTQQNIFIFEDGK